MSTPVDTAVLALSEMPEEPVSTPSPSLLLTDPWSRSWLLMPVVRACRSMARTACLPN